VAQSDILTDALH